MRKGKPVFSHPEGLIAWHYTVGEKYNSILQDGMIKRATAGVWPGEEPAVWFTISKSFPPTAFKMWRQDDGTLVTLSFQEMVDRDLKPIRIGVPASSVPKTWRIYRMQSGVTRRVADSLEESAKRLGDNTNMWRISFEPVSMDEVIAVHVHENGSWVDVRNSRSIADAKNIEEKRPTVWPGEKLR